VSIDPQFAANAAGIIGLYLNPPENAMVISIDKTLSIHTGYVKTSDGATMYSPLRGIKGDINLHVMS